MNIDKIEDEVKSAVRYINSSVRKSNNQDRDPEFWISLGKVLAYVDKTLEMKL